MPVNPENLDRDIEIIRKRRGEGAVHAGSKEPPVDRIPVDSPGIMRITGGGIPFGHMTRFWGGPSSGKSLLAYMVLKGAQKINKQTVYYNVEKQYDSEFVKKLGVDPEKLTIVQANLIEDIARECQVLLGSNHVHVIDSTSMAIPQDRLTKDPGDWDVALDARVWAKCLGYLHDAMDKSENSIIYIDHASVNFQTRSEKAMGGKELEHASSMSLHLKKTRWLYYDEHGMLQTEDKLKDKGVLGIGGQKEADGQEIVVQAAKTRVCRPLRKANLRLDLNTSKFDNTFELMEAAMYFDKQGNPARLSGNPPIAKRSGASGWFTLPSGQKVQGERGLRSLIDADEELSSEIYKAMMAGN